MNFVESSEVLRDMKAYILCSIHITFLNKQKTFDLSKSFGIPAIASAEIDKIVETSYFAITHLIPLSLSNCGISNF